GEAGGAGRVLRIVPPPCRRYGAGKMPAVRWTGENARPRDAGNCWSFSQCWYDVFSMPSLPQVRVKPPSLSAGETVGIVAPASNIQRSMLEAGCRALRDLGYKPFYLDSILDRDLYFAGSVE